MKDNIGNLKSHLEDKIEFLKGAGVYFWVAGGCVRDYFLDREPKDIDFYFPNTIDRRRATYFLTENNFELTRSYDNHDVLMKGNARYEIFHNQGDVTPKECIENFDFTVCGCALDSNYDFYCHCDFFKDLKTLQLKRISQKNRPPLTTCKRLKKMLNSGYNIDKDNLVKWLDDLEGSLG